MQTHILDYTASGIDGVTAIALRPVRFTQIRLRQCILVGFRLESLRPTGFAVTPAKLPNERLLRTRRLPTYG